ncbi:shufflon system plasmid conjugative transfer pilus tip adhesin PilV [Polaromonas sp.]|uniref:shufflon system plasmid conjugative transfer pilus tip adhesin PilV n=1 Tax=Polaromonas sp. TaxID=1869339 RepID=UPI00272F345D|nr:shufflon system plasmid conjugative transfer pilus tip adhesin PilV [Polaromonas sp.]MDP2449569.1 shufflon system plasmid conjugative transfer pilus tip adhesin PilV [Polaromonas sp.]
MSLRRQAGITLVEVVASLAIIAAASVGLVVMSDLYAEDAKASVTAGQVRSFGNAAQSYIKDNYAAVQAVATDTAPAMIDAATLVAAGALPSDFATRNSFGQTMCVLVLEPTAGRLQALVVSEGGRSIDDLSLGGIATMIGGSGGAVYETDPAVIRGASGGWQVPAAAFDDRTNNIGRRCDGTGGNVRLAAGTPVMALWFENGATSTAFLSRDAVPGRPELNEMNTPLVLNSIQIVGDACTRLGAVARSAAGGVLSCQGGTWKSQGSSFWDDPVATFAALPACDAAALNQTRIVGTPTVGSGPRAFTCNGTTWTALAVDDNGNISLAGVATAGKVQLTDTVIVGAACSNTGQLSRDSLGEALSCQGGTWKRQGIKPSLSVLAASVPAETLSGCYGTAGYVNVTTPGLYGIQVGALAYRYGGTYTVMYAFFRRPDGNTVCVGQDNMQHPNYGGGYFSPAAYCIEHLSAGNHYFTVGGSDASSCGTSTLSQTFGGTAYLRLLAPD